MRRPTVLLADDHVVFTDGIVRILKDRLDVVGTVTDGGSLFEATCRLRPDVIVTDISMPTAERARRAAPPESRSTTTAESSS